MGCVTSNLYEDVPAASVEKDEKTQKSTPRIVVHDKKPSNQITIASESLKEKTVVALSKDEFRKFQIASITKLSSDTKRYTFSFPSSNHISGLTTSSCVMIKAKSSGDIIARPYTPISLNDEKGKIEFVIKSYANGIVSGYLASLEVGDFVEMKGPFPKLEYKCNMKKNIGFLCGGTGITPCYQVIKQALMDRNDETTFTLIYSNRTEADILLKSELDELAANYSRLKIIYLVTSGANCTDCWIIPDDIMSKYGQIILTRISLPLIQATMPAVGSDNLIYVCGPPPFMEAISGDKHPDKSQGEVRGYLKEIGYDETMVYKF